MTRDQSQDELNLAIEQAIANPESANLKQLLHDLEQVVLGLAKESQLQVAGDVLTQLIDIYVSRVEQILDHWEEKFRPRHYEPILTTDMLQDVLRHTMVLNLDGIMEAEEPGLRQPMPSDSVISMVDKTNLLEFLSQLEQEQIKDQVFDIAHNEDITTWVQAVSCQMQKFPNQEVPLLELQRSLSMPLIEIWLALLLGGYTIEQRGDFYQLEGIWVKKQEHSKSMG
jgi:hypothetical protein